MSAQTQNNYNLCYTARAILSGFFFFRGDRGYRLCGALSVCLPFSLSVSLSLSPLSLHLFLPPAPSLRPPLSPPPPQALSLSVWLPSLPLSFSPPLRICLFLCVSVPPFSLLPLCLCLSPTPPSLASGRLINIEAVWILTVHVNSAAAYADTNLEAAVVA